MSMRVVPESEIRITYARSGGAGGQNVNKVNTKAALHWNVGESAAFSDDEKELIRAFAGRRLNSQDEIFLDADATRSQPQNRDAVIERLNELVDEALTPQKERKATKPTRASRERRLDNKHHTSRKKDFRKPPKMDS